MKNKKVVCYHHNDMDGRASAAIVKIVYPQAKLIEVNYGDDWNVNDIIDSVCIVVDFSFDNMDEMKQYPDIFCWIDHHQSAKEKNPKLWDSDEIDGLRSLEKSGCELTWEWFAPHDYTPAVIQHIGDRDLWKFKLQDTREIHEGLSLIIDKPEDLIPLIKNDREIPEIFARGQAILLAKERQIVQSFCDGLHFIYLMKRCRICNSNVNVSELGNYCCEMGYDVGVVWSQRKDKIVVSLRSVGDIDVSHIAKNFGGGGHKNAAGFTCKDYNDLVDKLCLGDKE